MPKIPWVEIPLGILMVFGVGLVVYGRLFIKQEKTTTKKNLVDNTEETIKTIAPRGIGYRMIQLTALLVIVPVVAIVACEDCITKEVAGTILASIAGYALGSVSKDDS